jgi:hypothetical protein
MTQEPTAAFAVSAQTDEGFFTVTLPLLRHETVDLKSGTKAFIADFGGTWNGHSVGMSLGLSLQWEEQVDSRLGISLWWGELGLWSVGELSHALLRELRALLALPDASACAKDQVTLRVVSLMGKPEPATNIRLKAFIEGTSAEEYAELYVTVDVPNKQVVLSEKDLEYRQPLLRGLSVAS